MSVVAGTGGMNRVNLEVGDLPTSRRVRDNEHLRLDVSIEDLRQGTEAEATQ